MIVKEGLAEIEVDEAEIPEERRRTGFYNPAMRENRDIAVSSLLAFGKGKVLDAFSATGIRAIRFCKEAGWKVEAAEVNELAFRKMEENIRRNGCRIKTYLRDCRRVMMENSYDAIDVDPYGSPAIFIYPSLLGLAKKSLLMVTATDTAVLFGVYPRKCFRMYGHFGSRSFSSKEIGVRILLSFIMKTAAMLGKAFKPLISYSFKHYVRVIGRVETSRKKANDILSQFSWVGKDYIYLGPLQDKEFINSALSKMGENVSGSSRQLLSSLLEELDVPFYYDTHNYGCPSLQAVKERVEAQGGRFSRTHFSPTSFKTDLSREMVEEILEEIKRKSRK